MQWAEGGSLDDYIDIRLGRTSPSPPPPSDGTSHSASTPQPADDVHTRAGRIRAFRAMQRAPPAEKERLGAMLGLDGGEGHAVDGHGGGGHGGNWRAVHLFSAEEVKGIFGGIVDGLAYLVSPSFTI